MPKNFGPRISVTVRHLMIRSWLKVKSSNYQIFERCHTDQVAEREACLRNCQLGRRGGVGARARYHALLRSYCLRDNARGDRSLAEPRLLGIPGRPGELPIHHLLSQINLTWRITHEHAEDWSHSSVCVHTCTCKSLLLQLYCTDPTRK